jgi:hypothetical protein
MVQVRILAAEHLLRSGARQHADAQGGLLDGWIGGRNPVNPDRNYLTQMLINELRVTQERYLLNQDQNERNACQRLSLTVVSPKPTD